MSSAAAIPTLHALPHDIVHLILSLPTGVDLLRLSHADASLYRGQLASNSDVWKSRLASDLPRATYENWSARYAPYNQDNDHESDGDSADAEAKLSQNAFKRFVAKIQRVFHRPTPQPGAHIPTPKPMSIPQSISPTNWKTAYLSSFSLQFSGCREDSDSRAVFRGSAVDLPPHIDRLWREGECSFGFDIWFALRQPHTVDGNKFLVGGVLLGAQTTHWMDRHRLQLNYRQLVHVDPHGDLYCDGQVIASDLILERWYHLVYSYTGATSTFTATQTRVYLDGELVHTSDRAIAVPDRWQSTGHSQLGNGFVGADFQNWYGFHGLIDECRFWKSAFSHHHVQLLQRGEEKAVRDDGVECVWSLKEVTDSPFYGGLTCVQCPRPQDRWCSSVRKELSLPGPIVPGMRHIPSSHFQPGVRHDSNVNYVMSGPTRCAASNITA